MNLTLSSRAHITYTNNYIKPIKDSISHKLAIYVYLLIQGLKPEIRNRRKKDQIKGQFSGNNHLSDILNVGLAKSQVHQILRNSFNDFSSYRREEAEEITLCKRRKRTKAPVKKGNCFYILGECLAASRIDPLI